MLDGLENGGFYNIDVNGVKKMEEKKIKFFNCEVSFIKSNCFKRMINMCKRGDSYKNIINRLCNDYKAFKNFTGEKNFKDSESFYNYIKEEKIKNKGGCQNEIL